MDHLGRADAVDDAHPRGRVPRVGRGGGQGLAGRDAGAQGRQVVFTGQLEQGAIAGGGGEDGRGALALDGLGQGLEARFRREGGRGAGGGRKDHQPAKAEGEGDGRGADDDVLRLQIKHVPREGVGHGEDVAMEMDAALGLAGGARGEGDQGRVVGGGVDGVEDRSWRQGHGGGLQLARGHHMPQRGGRRASLHHRLREGVIDQRVADLRLVDDFGQLGGAQHGHGGADDAAGLQDGEPGQHGPRAVRSVQQHAIARDETQVVGQHPRHAAGDGVHPAPRELVVRVDQGAPVGAGGRDGAAQQVGGGVQTLRIGQLGQAEDEVRLLLGRRQVVQHEPVDVCAAPHQRPPCMAASAWRAMTIFCTSDAPS